MVKVATFNVENLFGRAKALNLSSHEYADTILADIGLLQKELREPVYDKPEIIRLYKKVKDYVKFNVLRSKVGFLIVYQSSGVWKVAPNGEKDWFGFLEPKRAKFDDVCQGNTGKVIREMENDILCIVEAESLPVLRHFNTDQLRSRYPYKMLIDGNDQRGIDVGLYSMYDFGEIWTNMYAKSASGGNLFSRDCLEVEVKLNQNESIWVLLNHFKSKYGGSSDDRRKEQAEGVAKILDDYYDLRRDNVIVMGDLNDTPGSAPLEPLLGLDNLYDVLEEKVDDTKDRWTYHYKKNEQIDYILVSRPLQRALTSAGVFRKGMADVEEYSDGKIKSYKSVTDWRNAASDHGAVWAELDI